MQASTLTFYYDNGTPQWTQHHTVPTIQYQMSNSNNSYLPEQQRMYTQYSINNRKVQEK